MDYETWYRTFGNPYSPEPLKRPRSFFELDNFVMGFLHANPKKAWFRLWTDRRRRWWHMIQELDSATQLSEPMELMLELSGLSTQECLAVKACAGFPFSFEKIGSVLIEHYGSVRVRGARSLSGTSSPHTGKGKSWSHSGREIHLEVKLFGVGCRSRWASWRASWPWRSWHCWRRSWLWTCWPSRGCIPCRMWRRWWCYG